MNSPDEIRKKTVLDDSDQRKESLQKQDQELENRNFDKMLTRHGQQIMHIEKNIDEIKSLEKRVRSLENFKYLLLGIGIAIGVSIQAIIKTLL